MNRRLRSALAAVTLAHATLRTRLVVIVLTLLVIAFATVSVVTLTVVRNQLLAALDAQLSAASGRYSTAVEHDTGNDGDADNRVESSEPVAANTLGQQAGTFGARLVGGKPTAVGIVGRGPVTLTAAAVSALSAVPANGSARSIGLPGLGEYRLQAVAGRDGDVLLTGLPQEPVDHTLRDIELIELASLAGVLIVAGGLGAFAVRHALRPLTEVAVTARRIASLPLTDGGTRLDQRWSDPPARTEVGGVVAALNHMLGRIDDALAHRYRSEERLRRFAADASHELRSPLAVIRGHTQLMRREEADLPAPVQRGLQRVDAEAARMGQLVEDLLLLARLDAGRPLVREEVDLSRLAVEAITDARVAGPDHRWRLDLPAEPVTTIGDPLRLTQVLSNLLANARLHTPAGTTVTVALADHDDGSALLQVTDDGPGFPPDLRDTAFERFSRGDNARTRTGSGTGLGLAIVAAVVEAHGATVRLRSRPGATVISVQFPVTRSRVRPPNTSEVSSAGPRSGPDRPRADRTGID